MKVISLNIWGGRIKEPLLQFFDKYSDVDVFCLQEVYSKASEKITDEKEELSLDILTEINSILSDHRPLFKPVVKGIYGISMLIKKDIDLSSEGDVIIHHNMNYPGIGPTHTRNLQWVNCYLDEGPATILNVHGLWNGRGKGDSEERLLQSNKIKAFLDNLKSPYILCGDFNLRPDTQSLSIIDEGLKNCISDYKVNSTRTSYYQKEEKFADYIFSSKEIQVNEFKVLEDVVSDHAPLLIDFSLSRQSVII